MSIKKMREKRLQDCGKKFSAELKKKATPAEMRFKEILEKHGIKYFFQHPYQRGQKLYILDFFLPEYATVVEIDGEYHNTEEQRRIDDMRTTEILKKERFARVVRITNEKVFGSEHELMVWLAHQLCPWL